ncbi:hypothetical protein COT69_00490 [candidate division WWE3 bacterium CG09_land_8_20_14_0_10_39_24]|uniref:Uncharacterized protein n=2 Tax=Katanobacteria TaxID=422282 RepID=A0A2G9XDZ7_UNCKA|nr:MAG: hypothetical protein BK003_00480 [bacterium CG09_39_24]PIP04713.1 MAG: hypothetical protein COX53_00990 [candidate division WWE3 bacterium CG23_combo_of_CG06-09_8_20_14_all_40_14]PIS13104.1 MAG: hypothetical protein COT69_00490 [candidate division WWE3 bacterium CG09_land_8_20_14_0_10_39_24]
MIKSIDRDKKGNVLLKIKWDVAVFIDWANVYKLGYIVITKDVKFLKVYNEELTVHIWKRKCDMDLEMELDAFRDVRKIRLLYISNGRWGYENFI